MNPLFIYAEPRPFWQDMVLLAVIFIVMLVLVVIGGYVFVRIIAHVLNSHQGGWESSAKPLGFSIDRTAGGLYKPLVGERNGARISVNHFGIPRDVSNGVVTVDHCALVEVMLKQPLGFTLKLSRIETLWEKAAEHLFDNGDDIGHEAFDKIFKIDCSDLTSLRSLLGVEMMDAESSTVFTDLLLAAKKYPRVVLTDRSLSLGVKAELGQADFIEPVIVKAIYLASRVELAARR